MGPGIEGLKLMELSSQNSSQDPALSSLGHSLGEQRRQPHLALHELCFGAFLLVLWTRVSMQPCPEERLGRVSEVNSVVAEEISGEHGGWT